MRADQLDVRPRDSRDAKLINGPAEKTGERGSEWHFAARAETDGDTDHVLLGDKTFGKAVGELFIELLRISGVLGIAIHRDNAQIAFADARQRAAVSFASGHRITKLIVERRVARGRIVL